MFAAIHHIGGLSVSATIRRRAVPQWCGPLDMVVSVFTVIWWILWRFRILIPEAFVFSISGNVTKQFILRNPRTRRELHQEQRYMQNPKDRTWKVCMLRHALFCSCIAVIMMDKCSVPFLTILWVSRLLLCLSKWWHYLALRQLWRWWR
jgi:hypothetical protein